MDNRVKFTAIEMQYVSLFENVTGVNVKDCIIDDENGWVIFVVNAGQAKMAVGKGGRNVRILERMTGRKHKIIEYADDPVKFIQSALKPADVKEVSITEGADGGKIATVTVRPEDKGVAIGKNGRNIGQLRSLAKKYFQIQNVKIR